MSDNPRVDLTLMFATTIALAVQEGLSRYLAANYDVIKSVTIRYILFVLLALAYCTS